jgi:hypothetical protein
MRGVGPGKHHHSSRGRRMNGHDLGLWTRTAGSVMSVKKEDTCMNGNDLPLDACAVPQEALCQ